MLFHYVEGIYGAQISWASHNQCHITQQGSLYERINVIDFNLKVLLHTTPPEYLDFYGIKSFVPHFLFPKTHDKNEIYVAKSWRTFMQTYDRRSIWNDWDNISTDRLGQQENWHTPLCHPPECLCHWTGCSHCILPFPHNWTGTCWWNLKRHRDDRFRTLIHPPTHHTKAAENNAIQEKIHYTQAEIWPVKLKISLTAKSQEPPPVRVSEPACPTQQWSSTPPPFY